MNMCSGSLTLPLIPHKTLYYLSCFFPELNRCHLDLSEINRLIQRLQALEAGQAFTNGDLQRIISIQVAC